MAKRAAAREAGSRANRPAPRSAGEGLKTILAARVEPWWSGPGGGIAGSTYDFVVHIDGMGEAGDQPILYCGYASSRKRKDYVKLQASWSWMDRFQKERIPHAESNVTDEGRKVFAELFLKTRPHWDKRRFWWWVRERMVSLARDFGNESLLEPLSRYFDPEFTDGGASLKRTAYGALNALASLTGEDFRFDEKGKPRNIGEVVGDYREWLEKR